MQLLIDGYNLFKSVSLNPTLSSKQIHNLTKSIEQYGRQKDLAIILVFDGGLTPQLFCEYRKMLTIVQVGAQKTADDYIKNYLKNSKNADLLLVSSDRELTLYADTCSVPSIGSVDFWSIVQQVLKEKKIKNENKHDHIRKISTVDNKELDRLMYNSVAPSSLKDVQDDSYWIKEKGKTYSKNEKKLIEKLKKLR